MRERALELIAWSYTIWAERLLLAGLLVSSILMGWGVAWDIHWHWTVGRESFWIPPHMLLYWGAFLAGMLAFLASVRTGAAGRFRSSLTQGYGSIVIGSAIMVAAAGFDEFWHRTIGDRTIWSPPHVLGVTGAVVITLATAIALLNAGRRQVLPPLWARIGLLQLLAGLIIAAYFGLVPATLMVFLQGDTGLRFFVTSPYIVSALASLMIPALVTCDQQLLGRRGFEIAAMVGLGLWSFQTVFHLVTTPLVAGMLGYAMKPDAVPDLRFELLTLGFLLLPPLAVNRLALRQPWMVGAVIGALYTAGVALWLGVLGMERGVPVLGIAGVIALGALTALSGRLCGQWIERASAAGD